MLQLSLGLVEEFAWWRPRRTNSLGLARFYRQKSTNLHSPLWCERNIGSCSLRQRLAVAGKQAFGIGRLLL